VPAGNCRGIRSRWTEARESSRMHRYFWVHLRSNIALRIAQTRARIVRRGIIFILSRKVIVWLKPSGSALSSMNNPIIKSFYIIICVLVVYITTLFNVNLWINEYSSFYREYELIENQKSKRRLLAKVICFQS